MVKKIMHDPLFLAQKSVDATEADKQIVTDLLDTLKHMLVPDPVTESLITEKQETLDMQKDLFLDAKQERQCY